MTRKEFDARRGIERYEKLCCFLNSREEEDSVLEALENEGYIWGGTRDNPTAHHYGTPCYLIAKNDGMIQYSTIGFFDMLDGGLFSVDEFIEKLPFVSR